MLLSKRESELIIFWNFGLIKCGVIIYGCEEWRIGVDGGLEARW